MLVGRGWGWSAGFDPWKIEAVVQGAGKQVNGAVGRLGGGEVAGVFGVVRSGGEGSGPGAAVEVTLEFEDANPAPEGKSLSNAVKNMLQRFSSKKKG